MDKVLFEYIDMFGEKPMLLMTASYENEFYQDIMKKAIKRRKPISREEFDILVERLKYDVLEPTQEEIKQRNLDKYLGED